MLTPPLFLYKIFFHLLGTRPPSDEKYEKKGGSYRRNLPVFSFFFCLRPPSHLGPDLWDIAFALIIFDNTLNRSINNCIDFKIPKKKKKHLMVRKKKSNMFFTTKTKGTRLGPFGFWLLKRFNWCWRCKWLKNVTWNIAVLFFHEVFSR